MAERTLEAVIAQGRGPAPLTPGEDFRLTFAEILQAIEVQELPWDGGEDAVDTTIATGAWFDWTEDEKDALLMHAAAVVWRRKRRASGRPDAPKAKRDRLLRSMVESATGDYGLTRQEAIRAVAEVAGLTRKRASAIANERR